MNAADVTVLMIVVTGAFFVKAVTGLGGPILAIPLLAPTLGFEHAAIAVAFPNIVSNLLLVMDNRSASSASGEILKRFIPWGAAGAVAGSIVLVTVDDRWLSGSMAAIVFFYVGANLGGRSISLTPEAGMRAAAPVGAMAGLMHGATGNSGAIVGTFLHALALPRARFVFSAAVVFLLLGSTQVATLVAMGRVTAEIALPAALAILPVLAITPIGTRIGRRIPQQAFGRIVLVLLGVAGVRLLAAALGW